MTSFETLIASIDALKVEAEKFFTKGNNAAGTRLRKGLQEIKKQASGIRNEVTEAKKAAKSA
ncbi:MAG: histone H1 [Bacteroidia bacterium]